MTILNISMRGAFAIICTLLLPETLRADDVASGQPTNPPTSAPSAAADTMEGYVRLMPRFYDFSGDQGYLQRYRSLDAEDAGGFEETLAVVNELAFDLRGADAGPPRVEIIHTNPFVLNDQWHLRYRPGDAVRFELDWHDYQRPFEAFLPTPAPGTVSYAQRYNNDLLPDEVLFRRREDLTVAARIDPSAWSGGVAFVRELELRYGHSERRGNRQFSWIFGTVEDLVSPAGNNPDRWRGRTEELEEGIDRYAFKAAFAIGKGNATRLHIFGERFDNGAPTITNADIALYVPAVNTQSRTINYIADYSLSGGEIALRQALSNRLLLTADGYTERLEQESLAPLESQALYEAEIKASSFGVSLTWDARENLVLEAAGRWAERKNGTPVGTSASDPRTYLVRDRNLSSPFLKELSSATYGGTATVYTKRLAARFGVRHEDTERELVRGIGSNAIPERLWSYQAHSNPTTLWTSLSGRSSKLFRWSARYEYRTASDTWTISDPETAHRLRGTASLTSGSGTTGATASLSWEKSANDQFVFETDLGRAPQRMDLEMLNAAISAWVVVSTDLQLYAGCQRIHREQEGNLVTTDVRRWRARVTPLLVDDDLSYAAAVNVWHLGATAPLGERLLFGSTVFWVEADGGIESAVAPVRGYTLINNNALTLAITSEYQLSRRSRLDFRYAFNDYDDDSRPALSGKLQEISAGVTVSF